MLLLSNLLFSCLDLVFLAPFWGIQYHIMQHMIIRCLHGVPFWKLPFLPFSRFSNLYYPSEDQKNFGLLLSPPVKEVFFPFIVLQQLFFFFLTWVICFNKFSWLWCFFGLWGLSNCFFFPAFVVVFFSSLDPDAFLGSSSSSLESSV